jgi:hypothetical protein
MADELTTVDPATGEIFPAELTPTELAELARCEADIRDGLHKAWRAMRDICIKRLYRGGFKSFEDYVEERWGFSRERAYQLIDAANLIDEVSTTGLQIPNERTARALSAVPESNRIAVLLLANQASGGKLDSGWIKDASEVHDEIKATNGYVDDGDGGMTEAHKAVVDHRLERLNRQRQHIKDSEDRKRKSVRLVDYALFEVVDVNITRGMVYLHIGDDETLRQFAAFRRDQEPGLHLTVVQTALDPFNQPYSIVDMAARQ